MYITSDDGHEIANAAAKKYFKAWDGVNMNITTDKKFLWLAETGVGSYDTFVGQAKTLPRFEVMKTMRGTVEFSKGNIGIGKYMEFDKKYFPTWPLEYLSSCIGVVDKLEHMFHFDVKENEDKHILVLSNNTGDCMAIAYINGTTKDQEDKSMVDGETIVIEGIKVTIVLDDVMISVADPFGEF